MTQHNAVTNFIALAMSASQVGLTLKSGLVQCCRMEFRPDMTLVDNPVLTLYWGIDERCATLITEQGVLEGQWVGQSFHCNNSWGEPVQLQFFKMSTVAPVAAPPAANPALALESKDDGLDQIPRTVELIEFVRDYSAHTDDLDAESELRMRLLCLALQVMTNGQHDAFLSALQARLLDANDDLKSLSTMPVEQVLRHITPPTAVESKPAE